MERILILELTLCSFFFFQRTYAYPECIHEIIEQGCDDVLPKDEICNIHNGYRGMAVNGTIGGQPQAAEDSMNMLAWHPTIATEACKVAATCEFKHIRVKVDEFENGVGQNLYRTCSNKHRAPKWDKAIKAWYEERNSFDFCDEPNNNTGHYTQMMWGDSKYVGCGYCEYFKNDTHSKTPFCTLYVCHYGPAGNIEGEPPYKPLSPEFQCGG